MTRRAVLALLLLLPVPTLGVASGMFWWPESGLGQGLFMFSKLWIVAFPVLWHTVIERRPISFSPARKGGFVPAVLLGFGIAGVVAGAYFVVRAGGWLDVEVVRERAGMTNLDRPVVYLVGAAFWITVNSLMEEYVWRWFVFRQFERIVGGRWAVVLSALGFTAHHIVALSAQFDAGLTAIASVGVFVGGLVWSWLYLRYQSVWPCWASHAIVDVPIFVIGWFLIFG